MQKIFSTVWRYFNHSNPAKYQPWDVRFRLDSFGVTNSTKTLLQSQQPVMKWSLSRDTIASNVAGANSRLILHLLRL